MERRYRVRLDELLNDAAVRPGLLRGVLPRLECFLQPFVEALQSPAPPTNARHYVAGLLSDLDGKDVESIAYRHDRERQGLPKFLGQSEWGGRPRRGAWARPGGAALGEADGVLVFDPSACPKKGTASVGVPRPWCGRLGNIDNGPVGVSLGYVWRREHALVAVRRYLPTEGANHQRRRETVGGPAAIRFRTRHELIRERRDERGPSLPHACIAGDDELGRGAWCRQPVRSRDACSLLAVPSNTAVRDRTAPAPPYGGHGRRPRVPCTRVDRGCAAWPETAGPTVAVRDAAQGPVVGRVAWTLVPARTEGRPSDAAAWLVVFRERPGDGTGKHAYWLSNAALATPVAEFARVFQAQPRIDECLKRAQGAAGLADSQVRTWAGWQQHQTLSLSATWFRTPETRRGKNPDPGVDGAAGAGADRRTAEPALEPPWSGA